jgi:hypothetical protein
MNATSSREVLHTPRHNALVVLLIGSVFLGVGLSAVAAMWNGGERVFVWIWGSLWFLGSGAALLNGLMGLLKPPVYAVLSADGLALPFLRVTRIPWSHILDARLAPKKMTDGEGTRHVFKEPLILRLCDLASLQTGKAARWTRGMTAPLDDGTVEFMVQTQSCPLPANVFLARIQSRLLGEPVPVMPVMTAPGDTFGGRPLNPPPSRTRSSMNRIGSLIACLIGAALILHGAKKWKRGHDALRWEHATAVLKHADVAEDSTRRHGGAWQVRVHYEFAHQGRVHAGADHDSRYNDGSKAYVKSKLGEYPAGRRFTVCFDPRNPADSAFYPPTQRESYGWLAFGTVFFGLGLLQRRLLFS